MVTLALNDHVLKGAWPGFVTGKLSDVAGLAFFPLVLLGAWEVGLAAFGRWHGPRRAPLGVAVLVAGVVFTLVKTTPATAFAFNWLLGAIQWVPGALVSLVGGTRVPPLVSTGIRVDTTDLVALPALLVAAWVGARRLSPQGGRARLGRGASEVPA